MWVTQIFITVYLWVKNLFLQPSTFTVYNSIINYQNFCRYKTMEAKVTWASFVYLRYKREKTQPQWNATNWDPNTYDRWSQSFDIQYKLIWIQHNNPSEGLTWKPLTGAVGYRTNRSFVTLRTATEERRTVTAGYRSTCGEAEVRLTEHFNSHLN